MSQYNDFGLNQQDEQMHQLQQSPQQVPAATLTQDFSESRVQWHNGSANTSHTASRQPSERDVHSGSLRRIHTQMPSNDHTVNSVVASRMDASIRAPLVQQGHPTSSPSTVTASPAATARTGRSVSQATFVAPQSGETSSVPQLTSTQAMSQWQSAKTQSLPQPMFEVTTANNTAGGLQPGAAVTTPLLPLQKISAVLSILFAAAVTGLTLYQLIEYRGGFKSFYGQNAFNLHVFLMTVGFTVFLTPALLVKRLMPVEWRHSERVSNIATTLLHAGVLACLALGTWGATEALTSPWLFSVHSWIGCGAGVAVVVEILISAIARALPLTTSRRAEVGSWLAFNGLTTFTLGTMALVSGVQEWATLLQTGNSNYYPQLNTVGGLRYGRGNGEPIALGGRETRLLAGMGVGCLLMLGTAMYAAMPRLAVVHKTVPLSSAVQQQHFQLADKHAQMSAYNRRPSQSNVQHRQMAQHSSSSYIGSTASTRHQSRMPSMLGVDQIA